MGVISDGLQLTASCLHYRWGWDGVWFLIVENMALV